MSPQRKSGRLALAAARNGTGTIEFAFVVGALATLALGAADFGIGYWDYMQVQNAAHAGARYAMVNGFSSTGIANAVTGATGLSGVSASPAPSQACGCPNASSGITSATCGSSCSGGGTAQNYITVNAQVTYTTLVGWPGLSNPVTLTATAVVQ